jgi:hypothetical protein
MGSILLKAICCSLFMFSAAAVPGQTSGKAHALHLSGDYPVTHDPSIIKQADTCDATTGKLAMQISMIDWIGGWPNVALEE